MPASIVRPTWTYAIAVTLAVIALAACGASDTPQESTPTIDTLTPEAATPGGIGVDRGNGRGHSRAARGRARRAGVLLH